MSDEATGTETTTETTVDVVAADASTTEATSSTTEGGDLAADATGTVLGGEEEVSTETVVPDVYELKLADDQPIDAEVLEMATPALKALNITQEGAQSLMPFASEIANRAGAAAIAKHQLDAAAAFQAMNRENIENAKGDAEIGGAKWDETVTLSAKALDLLGFKAGSSFRAMLNETGLGNHPELIRAFRRIGERVSEDSFARPDAKPAVETNAARILYPNDKPKGA